MSAADADAHAEARAMLAAGDAKGAFRVLRPVLADTNLALDHARLVEALRLLAPIGRAIAGDEFGDVVEAAADAPGAAQAVFDLGYALLDQGLPDAAATLLTRANILAPREEAVVTELVAALEGAGRHAEAVRVLQAEPELLGASFMCRYLRAFNSLMSGDLGAARAAHARLAPGTQGDEPFLAARLTAMLARADAVGTACPLDGRDLRGWHYALTGGLLLHLSPYGFDEGMNGRYAYVQDSVALVLEGLRRVAAVLEAWRLDLPQVFALPDRDSAIVAQAAARWLGRPLAPWPAAGGSAPGLIVAYDLAEQPGEVLATLQEQRPGQVLWAHAACWTVRQPVAADLLTFLYQQNAAPWAARLDFDPQTRARRDTPADDAPVEILAQRVVTAETDPEYRHDGDALLALARAVMSAPDAGRPGPLRGSGTRERQWAGSPVPSNRFV